jgi:uncharacterized protein YdhG (YjbR/CyaY superfamily)
MKKKSKPGAQRISKRTPRTIDEYLDRVPEPARTTLQKMRTAIRSALPSNAKEIISYGIPAFRTTQVVVWFAAFAHHCSFFPTGRMIELFQDELKSYRLSKGTIQFPIDKPLPVALVKKIAKARLAAIADKRR